MWHLSAATASLLRFFATVHSHLSMSLLLGFQPASSGSEVMIIEPEVESQKTFPFCASKDGATFLGANSADSSACARVSCVELQSGVTLVNAPPAPSKKIPPIATPRMPFIEPSSVGGWSGCRCLGWPSEGVIPQTNGGCQEKKYRAEKKIGPDAGASSGDGESQPRGNARRGAAIAPTTTPGRR